MPIDESEVLPGLERSDFRIFGRGYRDFVRFGFRPRSDTTPVPLRPPLDWNIDPLNDRNWRFQLQAWRMLAPIWGEFYGRDWTRLHREVLPWIRDWYRYHVCEQRSANFDWLDMAAGLRAQHLAMLLALDRAGRIDLAGERDELLHLARLHIGKLRDERFIARSNHGIFQLVGLRLLGVLLAGSPECQGEKEYTSRLMLELLRAQFGPLGVHRENSPAYHNFALSEFARIRPELFSGIEDSYRSTLQQAIDVAPWFTLPDGSVCAIGDSEGKGTPFPETARSDGRITDPNGNTVLIRDLSQAGYAVARSSPDVPQAEASMLIVKAQAFTPVHAHADHMGFELFCAGGRLFVDSGKFSYENDEWRRYFVSDRAHNVVGLQGRSFGPHDTVRSVLHPVEVRDGCVVIRGDVDKRGGFSHHRRMTYSPDRTLVLDDEIRAGAGDSAVAYFHLAEGLDAVIASKQVHVLRQGVKVATVIVDDALVPEIVRGRTGPQIQGWLSRSYKNKVEATAIECRGSASVRKFRTTIALFDA